MRILPKLMLTATLAVGAAILTEAAVTAMPYGLAERSTQLSARLDDNALTEVRHRRGRRAAGAFAAGVLLGGALAAPYYYRPYPPYGYYSPAYPVYGPYSAGDPATVYCMQRFRSYDPYTRTYLGYDGFRHPCP
jgi:hypothetical protein